MTKRLIISLFAGIFIILFSYRGINAADNQAVKYYKYGAAYQKQEKYNDAVKYYSAAIKQQKNMWQAWLGMGMCYYKMKKNNNAALMFKHVLSLKPNEPTATKYLELVSPAKKQDSKLGEKTVKTKGDMMWRSALLPGLGQFYNNEHVKGYMYSLGFLASAAAVIKFTIDQNRAVDEYANTNYDFDTYYKKAQERTTMVWIPVGVAAAVWGLSIIDAYMSGADEDGTVKINAYLGDSGEAVASAYYEYRF